MLSSLVSNGQQPTSDQSELVVPWWSFTKTILAVTALSLVRDGRVGLDTPIPDQPFTLRQLLRHRQGSPIMVNLQIITPPLPTMRLHGQQTKGCSALMALGFDIPPELDGAIPMWVTFS